MSPFEASFGRFVRAFAGDIEDAGGVVALDGKTARRSFDKQNGSRPLHMVSAWAVEQRLVLGQRKVAMATCHAGMGQEQRNQRVA